MVSSFNDFMTYAYEFGLGFLHINLFRYFSLDKGTFSIHLLDFPSEGRNKGNNHLKRVHLCNRSKGISVVDAFLLRESFHDQTSFVMLNNMIKGKFGPIDPSTHNNIIYGWSWN